MILFWILWIIDAIVALITIWFFIVGLMDGSVSSFNSGIWTAMLIGLAALLGSTWWLRNEYLTIAKILLSILAIPALGYGLIIFVSLVTKARWN